MNFNLIAYNDTIIYQRWVTKIVTVVFKGQEKQSKKTLKEPEKILQQLLINTLKSILPTFLQKLTNIINQLKAQSQSDQ